MNKNFKNLVVWQKAMDLAVLAYELIERLPKHETFALADQMRRAAISVPSNIAEGSKRESDKEFRRFLAIANGSCAELETQIRIGVRLGYFSDQKAELTIQQCDEVTRLLHGLSNKLTGE